MERTYLPDVDMYNRQALPDLGKAALLVIDMQEHFVSIAETILHQVASVINACRTAGIRVLFTRHGHADSVKDGGRLVPWWGQAIHCNSPGWQLIASLSPQPGEVVIEKNRYSAFFQTKLDDVLHQWGVEDVIICGLLTNCCCETTARDAFMRDYRVFFLSDATAAVAEELHIASLKNLAYGFAHILDTKTLCRHLQSPVSL